MNSDDYRSIFDYYDDLDELLEMLERAKERQEEYKRREKEKARKQSKPVDQNMINAMKLMGLKEGFTKDDVKKSYRKLVKIHHPDQGGLEENFKKLKKAYDYIMKRLG